jgi:hypothetical protein
MTQFNCRWAPTFFGLGPEDRELVLLEPFFNLAYYFGMDWCTYYNFPITYRRWIMSRLNKELKKAADAGEQQMPSKGAQHNDPALRQQMGKQHPHAPHKLRRF